nr:hypothetical protein [Frankia nepalensis]
MCSEAARYITGVVLDVNGGISRRALSGATSTEAVEFRV